jgi:predicted acetyltransferase
MAIYGRFGYGQAASEVRLTIPRGAALREVPGASRHTVRLERASLDRHGELVADLHRRAGQDPTGHGGPINRPGWATRETPELQAAFWADPESFRKGKEARRIAIVELDGEPRGYATFRRSLDWGATGAQGTVSTGEVIALDAASARALWGVLLDLDLMTTTESSLLPVDDAITHLLVNTRAAQPKISDNLWARIVDLGPALAGRQYAADLDVVLDITDALLPDNAGRWRLRATAFGAATCERTDEAADLSLDVRALGSAYLGGITLASLSTAGLVAEHTTGALARTSAAFSWPVAPVTSWIF